MSNELMITDGGHSKICFVCAKRYANLPWLIGCNRYLVMERCSDCEKKPAISKAGVAMTRMERMT